MENSNTKTASLMAGHEITDVLVRGVWFAGLGLVITCILLMLLVVLMFHTLQHHHDNADESAASQDVVASVSSSVETFPKPRLQVAPEDDLAALRAQEDEELNHYGWIDKKAGVVRLPIERAMELLLQRGLPVRGQPGAPPPTRTVLDMQQARPSDWSNPQNK